MTDTSKDEPKTPEDEPKTPEDVPKSPEDEPNSPEEEPNTRKIIGKFDSTAITTCVSAFKESDSWD